MSSAHPSVEAFAVRPDPDLAAYQAQLAQVYAASIYGAGLEGRLMRRGHELMEKPIGVGERLDTVLEIGAGAAPHFPYVRHPFVRYLVTDHSPDMLDQARGAIADERVEFAQSSAERLEFADGSIDRLIASHVLEHLYRPHEVLREWARVIRPGGIISIALPCDPGLMWRFGRTLGPRRSAERRGVPYDYWMAREHVNSITGLLALIRYYFEDCREIWYPARIPFSDANLLYVCTIRNTPRARVTG
jgi:SAM-dependent methyltransferase